MSFTKRGKLWEWGHSLWLIWSFIPYLAWVAFFYIGFRVRQKKWAVFGFFYLLPLLLAIIFLIPEHKDHETLVVFAIVSFWIMAIVHSFMIRKKYVLLLGARKTSLINERKTTQEREKLPVDGSAGHESLESLRIEKEEKKEEAYLCEECGKKFSLSFWGGLFGEKNLCPECKKIKKERIDAYVQKLETFGKDGYFSSGEEKELRQLKITLGLKDEDLKDVQSELENLRRNSKFVDFKGRAEKLFDALDALTQENIDELQKFAWASDLQARDFSPYIEKLTTVLKFKLFAEQLLNGQLDIISNPPVILKKGEKAYFVSPVDVREQITKTYTHRAYAGTRIKIGKIPIYLGGSTPITETGEEIIRIGTGTFVITNNRVILSGTKINYTIPLDKIIDTELFSDGLQIMYEGRYGGRFYEINESWKADMIIKAFLKQ